MLKNDKKTLYTQTVDFEYERIINQMGWGGKTLRITPKQSAARHSFHAPMLLYVGSGNKANLSFFFTRENDFNKFDIFMSIRRLTIN